MYREIQSEKESIIHNKLSVHRHPFPRAFLGNHHAAPIMFRMVGAALLLNVYHCVSRTEAFLMATTLVILNDYDAALVLNSKSMLCLLFVIV
jgi:hypothetical protein